MPGLKRVVQRRCEHRGCERFGMPVSTGDVCSACKNPLVVKTKFEAWVAIVAGGAVLVILIPTILLLRSKSSPTHPFAPPAGVTTPASLPPQPPPASAAEPGAIQVASQAVGRGQKLADRGLYEEARLEFLRATVADPESPVAWANLGASAALTRRVEEARGAYEKALALSPDNWLTHYNLAVLLAREGDRDGAVRHLERFSALIGPRDEKRQRAVDDLRRDPALRGLLEDSRLRDLAAQPGGQS